MSVDVGASAIRNIQPEFVRVAGTVVGDRQCHHDRPVPPHDRAGRVAVHGGEQRLPATAAAHVLHLAGQLGKRPLRLSGWQQILGHVHGVLPPSAPGSVDRPASPGWLSVDRRAQLFGDRPGGVLAVCSRSSQRIRPGPRTGLNLAAAHLDLHAGRQHRLGDAVRAVRGRSGGAQIEDLMLLGAPSSALREQQLGVRASGRQRLGALEQLAVVQATAVWLDRIRITVSSVPSACDHSAFGPRTRRSPRRRVRSGTCAWWFDDRQRTGRLATAHWDVVEPIEHGVGQVRRRMLYRSPSNE